MMKVKIVYMDAKELEVTISSKDSKKFFEAIGNHQFYFDDRKGRGFWTDIDKIRHIVTEDFPDDKPVSPKENSCSSEACEGNQGDREPNLLSETSERHEEVES